MVWFTFITPLILAPLGAWFLARYRLDLFVLSAGVAAISVLVTFGLLRTQYSLFQIGPFMLISQAASFVLTFFEAAWVASVWRNRLS